MTAVDDVHAQPAPALAASAPSGPAPQPAGLTHTGTGIVALVFGVLQFVALPVVGAIVALVAGYMSKHQAERDPTASDELGHVGRVLGWVGLGLTVGALALAAILVTAVIAFGLGIELLTVL